MKHTTATLEGRPVSGGIAVGRAEIRLEDPSVVPVYQLGGDAEVEQEVEAFREAMKAADQEAEKDVDWAKENLPESEAEIFMAQRAILRDPSLVEWVEDRIRKDRTNAAAAVRHRFDDFRRILQESSSEIIRNRVLDVTDAERLIHAHLLGHATKEARYADSSDGGGEPVVLVTNDPPPSLLARVDPRQIVGIVCERGAGMGHIAVLTRALHLPAVIQVEGLLAHIRDGDTVAIDGDEGRIVVNPGSEELEKMRKRERQRRILLPPTPTDPRAERVTAGGQRVFLLGNAFSQREVDFAAQVDADGIGLYRTEFFYLSKNRLPTESELVSLYSAAACSFTEDPVDIRLLDLGSDKHLPGVRTPAERNPALGMRSLRFLFENPYLLQPQLRAILQAAADGPVRLLLPMVSGVEEIRQVRQLLADCHEDLRGEGVRHDPDLRVGAMIEHPAGVMMAEEIFAEADFVSIGTNDLTMYTLAVDRDSAQLAGYYDAFHPAVIRSLRRLCDVAESTGKPLSICGELAGDPGVTGLLVGLGIRRLSMTPQWIVPVGHGLRSIDETRWRRVAEEISTMGSAEEIRKHVREAQKDG